MSFFSKIRGTLEGIFQIGVGGPQIKRETATLAARNAADAAYAIMRGAAPVGGDDLINLTYFNANNNAAQGLTYVKIILAQSGLTSSAAIPNNAIVMDVRLDVSVAYDNAATIAATRTGGGATILQAADTDPTLIQTNQVPQVTDWGSTGAGTVDVTITGGPTVGDAVLYIGYTTPTDIS